jgi:hypothetical protein
MPASVKYRERMSDGSLKALKTAACSPRCSTSRISAEPVVDIRNLVAKLVFLVVEFPGDLFRHGQMAVCTGRYLFRRELRKKKSNFNGQETAAWILQQ